MDQIFCCSCGDQIEPGLEAMIAVLYKEVASTEAEQDFMAVVCWECSRQHKVDALRPVIEAMVSARIARINDPEKRYTP